MQQIFELITLAGHNLKNRLVMAPLTRSRAQPDGVPGELAAQYYAQRSGLGLIIAEATQPLQKTYSNLLTVHLMFSSYFFVNT